MKTSTSIFVVICTRQRYKNVYIVFYIAYVVHLIYWMYAAGKSSSIVLYKCNIVGPISK